MLLAKMHQFVSSLPPDFSLANIKRDDAVTLIRQIELDGPQEPAMSPLEEAFTPMRHDLNPDEEFMAWNAPRSPVLDPIMEAEQPSPPSPPQQPILAEDESGPMSLFYENLLSDFEFGPTIPMGWPLEEPITPSLTSTITTEEEEKDEDILVGHIPPKTIPNCKGFFLDKTDEEQEDAPIANPKGLILDNSDVTDEEEEDISIQMC